MGGGGRGAMRMAAKLAGFGVAASGIRGVPLAPPAEQSIRNASRPVSSVVSSSSSQRAKAAEVAPLHTAASWDVDDGELIMEAGEPMPRVVFIGVPSFQEAKAATTELKDAVEKIYLSSNSSECEGSSPGVKSLLCLLFILGWRQNLVSLRLFQILRCQSMLFRLFNCLVQVLRPRLFSLLLLVTQMYGMQSCKILR